MGFPGSVLVGVLVGFYVSGSSDADLKITAEPGDDVTLTCKAPENMKMKSLEWTRVDLEEGEYVFVYRNRGINLDDQHESFRNRVFLNNSQMKDGDLSVVLKNVTVNDTGTYTCSVMRENDPDREMILIGSVHLSVIPPGDKDGVSHGNLGLIPLSGLLLLTIFLLLVS
ncbi:V-set domain containing T-cell activation inhibitor 1 [Oryzias melastigma]|uniref:V-set domain containing T-cell activation inhibitor 1 n=1 Tax=Oryzias melastigma TaxID=30732 RepID=UPI000CF81806|nr:V-set domain containing T-cell activation inhibitor 1 [Oryzias melastigma]